jgi:NitT/TauT family transport system substrate-binding protein
MPSVSSATTSTGSSSWPGRRWSYGRWRDYDTEATVRFYALRLREVGMITSTPQKIIAGSTDWRFVNELKKELKG